MPHQGDQRKQIECPDVFGEVQAVWVILFVAGYRICIMVNAGNNLCYLFVEASRALDTCTCAASTAKKIYEIRFR
jgi:hypothetical protein